MRDVALPLVHALTITFEATRYAYDLGGDSLWVGGLCVLVGLSGLGLRISLDYKDGDPTRLLKEANWFIRSTYALVKRRITGRADWDPVPHHPSYLIGIRPPYTDLDDETWVLCPGPGFRRRRYLFGSRFYGSDTHEKRPLPVPRGDGSSGSAIWARPLFLHPGELVAPLRAAIPHLGS
jgi:hypothetical protein